MSAYLESAPFRTPDELLSYAGQLEWRSGHVRPRSSNRRLSARDDGISNPKLLACHDMRGNYLNDRFTCGAAFGNPYQIMHWECIDSFCYFSHNLLSIPPLPWVQCCRAYGVKVLGTFITEWREGLTACKAMFSSRAVTMQLIDSIARISSDSRIDGWLINIENPLPEKEMVENVIFFLKELSAKLRVTNKSSEVLWYDSVTLEGKLDWQNTLNDQNVAFFEAADGIFLNYSWKNDGPSTLAEWMNSRGYPVDKREKVYFGCDVFGRGTAFGGMFDAHRAVESAHAEQFSVALFAPGWVLENAICDDTQKHEFNCILKNFIAANTKLWRPLSVARHEFATVASLPFATSFSTSVGRAVFVNGHPVRHWGSSNLVVNTSVPNAVESRPFYDLTLQDCHFSNSLLAPEFESPIGISICTDSSYYGTSSLEFNAIVFDETNNNIKIGGSTFLSSKLCDDLFGLKFDLGDRSGDENSIELSIVYCMNNNLTAFNCLDILLNVVDGDNAEHEVALGIEDIAGMMISAKRQQRLSRVELLSQSAGRICECVCANDSIFSSKEDSVWLRDTYILRITETLRTSIFMRIGLRARVRTDGHPSRAEGSDSGTSCNVHVLLDSLCLRMVHVQDGIEDNRSILSASGSEVSTDAVEIESIRYIERRSFELKIWTVSTFRAWFLIHLPSRRMSSELLGKLALHSTGASILNNSEHRNHLRGSIAHDASTNTCRYAYLPSLLELGLHEINLDDASISTGYLGRSDTKAMIYQIDESDFVAWENGEAQYFLIQPVDMWYSAVDVVRCPVIRVDPL